MTTEMGTKREESVLTWSARLAGVEAVYHEDTARPLMVRRSEVGHMRGERLSADSLSHKYTRPGSPEKRPTCATTPLNHGPLPSIGGEISIIDRDAVSFLPAPS